MMTFKFNWYVLTDAAEVTCSECADGKVVSLTAKTETLPIQRYVDIVKEIDDNAMLEFRRESVKVSQIQLLQTRTFITHWVIG